ncbi:MAG: hypothetical protein KKE77_04005 [Alphaproteobacteria bacterium]|jgi:Tfp pilus assembly protein PilO|nr:hypothetical protein [Alphaproteobacteria bacterium]MBU1756364.1 hypothetical protein [Alphaproteobacteria bacterium]MBU2033218.1 hypothetical protein [Alphaproteobacteria bacterium]MBU2340392.1 hypothetical protein [Alphaproteobacteria bacterium]
MFEPSLVIAAAALLGLGIVAATLLLGWRGWLDLKQRELDSHRGEQRDTGSTMGAARIEISDLKERIRKLEAIANGVDL